MTTEINGILIHTDCLHFRGDVPCKPNKDHGYHCSGCTAYTKINKRVLLIKLGAIGDVIRTTPLLHRIRREYPNARITWLTHTPAILPADAIEEVLKLDLAATLYLQEASFDLLINLDKDREACALHSTIKAKKKLGFTLHGNIPFPANALAGHKYLTGVFDDISLSNTKSYVEEIFEICGWDFQGEEYVFDTHQEKGFTWPFTNNKRRVGLNTGCGDRWTTRLWSDDKWIELISLLQKANYEVVLLGGEQEHERNQKLSQDTNAEYFGHFPLPQFINLMYQMDLIVTQVTMAMHIAIALKKKIVLMNNIFNPHEFDLYGRGHVVEPERTCVCFYRGTCKRGISCMEDLPADKVFKHAVALLEKE
ncbi:glycosyltransferase family 9 protein [Pontibacter toksunensis]|uniref:Glycosyltransferase family 9 protein n=1 Tax=Pontibacter toksunensis TaxID=1332631 RepID=A0ABW6BUF8_9BACT